MKVTEIKTQKQLKEELDKIVKKYLPKKYKNQDYYDYKPIEFIGKKPPRVL